MQNHKPKLLIMSGLKDSRDLANQIYTILKEDYKMGDGVEIIQALSRDEVPKGTLKDHKAPLVIDFFPDKEVQCDVGRNVLKDMIRGKHVALVQYLYNPTNIRSADYASLNDRFFNTIGILKNFNRNLNKELTHTTLVAPYITYLRSHSIEKYEKVGFFQFDSLSTMVEMYAKSGLNNMLGIDPHSMKIKDIASDFGMEFWDINPFQSGRSINPAKLGLIDTKEIEKVMSNLRPFIERFRKLKEDNQNHLYVGSLDDGTEKRCENFVDRAHPELPFPHILLAYLWKERFSYDGSTIQFKSFSQINEKNIDPEGTYILIDDMFASGGSVDKSATMLKSYGAKRVEAWVAHAVTAPSQVEKAKKITSVDKVVCLDTIIQDPSLGFEYIHASADLLAAELYKVHQKFLSSR